MGSLLLTVRRLAIFAILLFAYLYYRSAGDAQLASIGILAFAAIAQLAPAFFGGLIWRNATARGAIAGMTVGILTWAYTLLLPTFWDSAILDAGPVGIEALRPQHLFGLEPAAAGARRAVEPVAQYPDLYRLLARPRAEPDRADAGRRVRADACADDAELPAVALVGDGRGTDCRPSPAISARSARRQSFESFAAARRISLEPDAEADFELMRYAEHQLASAIGAASSRLVLSLLLRKRTVSTKAALKLLDDANAAIHYNREILQTALDHVRQGIAVYDKDLRLVCWNRQFGEILDLPPELTRIGVHLEEIVRHNAEQGALGPGPVEPLVRARLDHYVTDSEPFLKRFADRGLVVEVRTNRMPDGGIVTTATDITPSVVAAEALERANATLEMRVRERTTELTRLNAELGRAKADADEANISKTRFLAAASHDILQPLNAARLYVTSLLERQGSGEDGQLIENVDASLDAVEEIFGALLDISRLDTGAMRAEFVELPHRRVAAPARGRVHAARARKGPGADVHALLARDPLRPEAAPAAPAKPRLQRDQIHARRAACWSAAGGAATSCGSTCSTPAWAFRPRRSGWSSASSSGSTRAPRWRAGWASGSPSSSASGACSITRSTCARCRGRGSRFSVEVPVSSAAPAQAPREVARRRPRTARRHHGAVHRQRAEGARRHGDAARRLGLPGAEGAGPRHRHRGHRPRRAACRTGFWSITISIAATASTPSPSCAGALARDLPAILITADRSPQCATKRAPATCRC